MSLNKFVNKNSPWQRISHWLLGFILLAGLIVLVTHIGEVDDFIQLVKRMEPVWLIVAIVLQCLTYISVAGVWYFALREANSTNTFISLIPLGIAKLFTDKAIPSGGVSGTAFFITALNRRGVASPVCMATLLLSLVTYYTAYLVVGLTAVFVLFSYHKLDNWLALLFGSFSLVAVGIPLAILWIQRRGKREVPAIIKKLPVLETLAKSMSNVSGELLYKPKLILIAALLHLSIFMLDAATLWVMLKVLGISISFWVAYTAFILSSIVMTLGPIPLGIGSFEATSVGTLTMLSVPVEAALAATLMLRGFTLWLPMLPGMWLAKRALA